MRLKLVLSLAAILTLSCQQNSSKVQDSTPNNVEVSSTLSVDEQKTEYKKLSMMVEKVLVKESDNKTRAKMISNFMLKSKLSENDKNDILKKAMIKLDLPTEDRKKISLSLSYLRRMDSNK
tara:strand:+ start:364 stop:726 length:363 start_codon:yes stop_codon:yes gene_type:complete